MYKFWLEIACGKPAQIYVGVNVYSTAYLRLQLILQKYLLYYTN